MPRCPQCSSHAVYVLRVVNYLTCEVVTTVDDATTPSGAALLPDGNDVADRAYQRRLLGVVMLAVTAFGSLMTIVTVSLGQIAEDLNSTRAGLTWMITGLMLAMAVLTPIAGHLGKRPALGQWLRDRFPATDTDLCLQ